MKKIIEAVLIGGGQRGGGAYGNYVLDHPDEIRYVAVAEPDAERRAWIARRHNIPLEKQFESWEALLEKPQMGQAALVCTQDQMHTLPTLSALQKGYHVLLEKPMAHRLEDCRKLVEASEAYGRQLHICHVLRFTRHFSRMREILEAGSLGDVVNISQRENVGWWHMAHSFVRGHWRNKEESSPMILAKCCHDLDLLVWLLDSTCDSLSSVGRLVHFRPEYAPPGAPLRCLDGCPTAETCPYYAPFIYVDRTPLWRNFAESSTGLEHWVTTTQLHAPGLLKLLGKVVPPVRQVSEYNGWPTSAVTMDNRPEAILEALRTGPYGRCVYHCDNDVVDHQVVAMQFANGASASLTMHGHSNMEGRTTRIEGTRAQLLSAFGMGGSWIEVREHRSGKRTRYNTSTRGGAGHGGGDTGLMASFVQAVREEDASKARTTARQSLESHLMAFAAEDARLEGKTVRMDEYRSYHR